MAVLVKVFVVLMRPSSGQTSSCFRDLMCYGALLNDWSTYECGLDIDLVLPVNLELSG